MNASWIHTNKYEEKTLGLVPGKAHGKYIYILTRCPHDWSEIFENIECFLQGSSRVRQSSMWAILKFSCMVGLVSKSAKGPNSSDADQQG